MIGMKCWRKGRQKWSGHSEHTEVSCSYRHADSVQTRAQWLKPHSLEVGLNLHPNLAIPYTQPGQLRLGFLWIRERGRLEICVGRIILMMATSRYSLTVSSHLWFNTKINCGTSPAQLDHMPLFLKVCYHLKKKKNLLLLKLWIVF